MSIYANRGEKLQEDDYELPFAELLELLKKDGFIIGADDYAEFTAVYNRFQLSDTKELKYYLAPIVCRNEDEQRRFYILFDSVTTRNEGRVLIFFRKQSRWLVAMALLLVVFLLYRALPFTPKTSKKIIPVVKAFITQDGPFDNRVGQHLVFNTYASFVNKKDTAEIIAAWNFGDGSAVVYGHLVQHTYSRPAEYRIRLTLTGRNDSINPSVSETALTICPGVVQLTADKNRDLFTDDSVKINVTRNNPEYAGNDFTWKIINDSNNVVIDTIKNSRPALSYTFHQSGNYRISFNYSHYDCVLGELRFRVKDRQSYGMNIRAVGNPVSNLLSVNPLPMLLAGLFGLLNFVLALYFFSKKVKPKGSLPPINKGLFTGVDPPHEIRFPPKEQYVQHLPELSRVAYDLGRRNEAENSHLDISATIRNTIKNRGIFSPGYSNRQKAPGYLIFIDETNSDNQQVHLFQYLVKTLVKENVSLESYFYFRKATSFYRHESKTTVTYNQLRDHYYDAHLIILGTGYDLLHAGLPLVDSFYKKEMGYWQKRILITPVPAKDWGSNEKILSAFFRVIPSDIAGLLNIIGLINQETTASKPFEEEWQTYSVKYEDATDVVNLKKYLDDEDVFQWLCGLSIYHNIRWEVIIEIGRHILTANNSIGKLNYTNMLKLARIKWLEQGAFSTSIRLALMKELSVKNELVARSAMLQLLEEAETGISSTSFVYEELEVQKYTNSFVLYANDHIRNEQYKPEAEKFISLWNENKVLDFSLTKYLKKDRSWETPINSTKKANANISIEKYIQENYEIDPEETQKERWWNKLNGTICAIMAAAALLLIVAVYGYKNGISKLSINKKILLVKSQKPDNTDVVFNLHYNDCLTKYKDSILRLEPVLVVDTQRYQSDLLVNAGGATFNDSVTNYSIVFRNVNFSRSEGKRSSVSIRGPSVAVLNEDISLTHQMYRLSLHGNGCGADTSNVSYYLGAIKLNAVDIDRPLSDCVKRINNPPNRYLFILLVGFIGGIVALLMPSTYPMIPITVVFFTRRSLTRSRGILNAFFYGVFIFLIYFALSIPVYFIGKLHMLDNVFANPWPNLLFAGIILIFVVSFFGYFEITLPSRLSNAADAKSSTKGLIGIFFMALTLVIVSFSCSGPLIISLLIGTLTDTSGTVGFMAGMAGFGLALGIPFFLLAIFPGWLQYLPKSGGWLASVKIVSGFILLAFAVKLLSNADLVAHFGVLKKEVFFSLWILIGISIVLYLTGIIKFKQDSPPVKPGRARITIALFFLAFTLCLVPGVTSIKWPTLPFISKIFPPANYSIYKNPPGKLMQDITGNLDKAIRLSKAQNKPLLISFTNRQFNSLKMNEYISSDSAVNSYISRNFIRVSLQVDDNQELPADQQFTYLTKGGLRKDIKTRGDVWTTLQAENFSSQVVPLNAILNPAGQLVNNPIGYTSYPDEYLEWLKCGNRPLGK